MTAPTYNELLDAIRSACDGSSAFPALAGLLTVILDVYAQLETPEQVLTLRDDLLQITLMIEVSDLGQIGLLQRSVGGIMPEDPSKVR